MMTRDEVVAALQAGAPALADESGITAIWLFGPAALSASGPIDEVNLFLAFSRSPRLHEFMALRDRLQQLLGGLRVEPVVRPKQLPDGIDDPLANAIHLF